MNYSGYFCGKFGICGFIDYDYNSFICYDVSSDIGMGIVFGDM